MASELPVQMMSGHGHEYCVDTKIVETILPKDTTQITAAPSGCIRNGYWGEEVSAFLDTSQDAFRKIDVSRLRLTEQVGIAHLDHQFDNVHASSFHVHRPEESVHVSKFFPFMFPYSTEKPQTGLLRPSGVIRQSDRPQKKTYVFKHNQDLSRAEITQTEFLALNEDVVYPSQEQLREELKKYPDTLTYKNLSDIASRFAKRTDEIMRDLGPGIYYFLACRSTTKECQEDAERARAKSAIRQRSWDDTIRATIIGDPENAANFITKQESEIVKDRLLPSDIKIMRGMTTREDIKAALTKLLPTKNIYPPASKPRSTTQVKPRGVGKGRRTRRQKKKVRRSS